MQYRTNLCLLFFLVFAAFHARTAAASDGMFQTDHFSGSGNCASCHDDITADDGSDLSFRKDWAATMMANSARDPYWQAKVASELAQHPHLTDEINDMCTRCHAPMASVETELQMSSHGVFGDGLLDPSHPLHDAAMDGVSCTACHQLQPAEVEDSHSGKFSIDPDQRLAFGPRADSPRNPMEMNSGFTPLHGAHMSDSSACASCHTLKTPFVDGEGNIASTTPDREFPEQMPYVEWEHSIYGPGGRREQSCQGCHMPRRERSPLANRPRWLGSRTDVAEHGFLGANTLMLEILSENAEELGVPQANFAKSIADTRAFLRNGVYLKVTRAEMADGELKLDVIVVNRTGHKFPTGYPSRRAYLHVTITDSQGNVLFESGRLKDNGQVAGIRSDHFETGYEPHYRVIRHWSQVQVYEAIMGDTEGAVTHSLLSAADYLKDNRIPPFGYDKAAVPKDIAVVGTALADYSFVGGHDTVQYRIALPVMEAVDVDIELNYQAIGYASVKDLAKSSDHPVVSRFVNYYEAADNKTETIANVTTNVRP